MGKVWLLGLALAAADLVDVGDPALGWTIDMPYARTDNFTGKQLYPVARCLLRPEVVAMLNKAQTHLDQYHAGHRLVLKDCYRPVSVQRLMWDLVKDTPQRAYVANPNTRTGSVHNYGAAVDLTLATATGEELDMGTAYDYFGELAEPRHEDRLLREGRLTPAQVNARRMLREAMCKGGGFKAIPNEWWHFDAWQGAALRARYRKLDVPLAPPNHSP